MIRCEEHPNLTLNKCEKFNALMLWLVRRGHESWWILARQELFVATMPIVNNPKVGPIWLNFWWIRIAGVVIVSVLETDSRSKDRHGNIQRPISYAKALLSCESP